MSPKTLKTEYGRNSVVRQTAEYDGRQYGGDKKAETGLLYGSQRPRGMEDDVVDNVIPEKGQDRIKISQSLVRAALTGLPLLLRGSRKRTHRADKR